MPASQASTKSRVPQQIQERHAKAIAPYLKAAEPDASAPAAATAPALPTASAATPADPLIDARANDPNYWQQRFKVTEGMLARERQAAKDRETSKNQQIVDLQTQVRDLKAAVPAAPIDLSEFFTPEEIAAYGEPQCRVMATTAMRAAEKQAKNLIAAEVQPLRDRQASDAQADEAAAKQEFFDKIEAQVPDFDDADPRWVAWLQEIDEHTGAPRQAVLTIHSASRNVMGCVKVIKEWKASLAVPTPPVSPSGTGAAPTGAGDAAPATPEAVSALTPPSDAEVKEFYKRSSLNKVKGPERVAFEARMKLRQQPRAAA
jgi:hypothetical protein